MKIQNYFLLFIALFLTTIGYSQKLNLKSVKDWKIVVVNDAIPSEKFAAQEFQSLFNQATGIKLAITDSPNAKLKNIFIGYSSVVKKLMPDIDNMDLGQEGLKIKITKDNIAIIGGKPRGTLYGVYEFAERYLGVRFLAYDYTYVTDKKNKTIIPCEEYTYIPCFMYRNVYYRENISHPEFSVRMRYNAFEQDIKYGGVSDMHFVNHSFNRQLPLNTYSKEHPEYFAEVKGKRLLDPAAQICVTNPEVVSIMTKAVLNEIVEHPENKNISVVQNDSYLYCTCKNCEEINQKEDTPMGSHLAMVNTIADEVAKQYPDKIIGTLAYQYTRKPPKTIVPRDNVMIQLCSIECNLLHPYADKNSKMNKPFGDDLASWGKICKNLWIWDYIVDYNLYGLPFPNMKSIGQNIKWYKANNIKGVFMEANYSSEAGEMSDLRNYVTSRCLWNPELDSWELTKEFCNLYYKKAARPILEYLTTLHNNVETKHLSGQFNSSAPAIVGDSDFANYIFSKFEEAMKLADDDTVRNRVERASLCAYVAVIEMEKGDGADSVQRAKFISSDRDLKIMKTFFELAKKHGMKNYRETATSTDVEKSYANELNIKVQL